MTTDYKMWINYDNDQKRYCIPVLPEELKMTVKGQAISVGIDKFGEVLHKAKRDAEVISFSSFFPAGYGSYCNCLEGDFREPEEWVRWLKEMEEAPNPAHVVLTNAPLGINIYADITSFIPEMQGGDVGTVYYSLEMKEHRTPSIRTYKKGAKKTKVTLKKKRSSNKTKKKTYTVKKGDCLWNISKKFLGKGSSWKKIYNLNKSVIEKAAKKHGKKSSSNGHWIYPGTKLAIPK